MSKKFFPKHYIVYALIVGIQLLVIIFWASQKGNFHCDEMLSLGYASNYTGLGDTARYIYEAPEWRLDDWIDNADLKKYLTVSEEEQFFNLSFAEGAKAFVTGRSYLLFLILRSL